MPGPLSAGQIWIDVGMDTHALDRDLNSTKRKFNNTLNSMQSHMRTFATNMTRLWHSALLGFAMFGVSAGTAISQFASLEEAQADLAKRMNTSRDAIQGITKDLTALSTTMPTTRKELTNIAVSAAQVGVSRDNIVKFVEVMKQFEIATGRAADEAAKDFKRIMNVTGEPISNVENLGSALAKLVDQFPVADVETIQQVMMKMGRTIGAAMDVSSTELAALSTMVSSMAKRAARPASQMRKLFTEMATDAEEFAQIAGVSAENMTAAINEGPVQAVITLIEQLREVDGAVERFQAMSEVSRTTAKAIAPLIENLPDLKRTLDEAGIAFKNNEELMNDYETQLSTISSQLKITWGNIQTFTQTIGQALTPALRKLNKNALSPFSANLVDIVNNAPEARKAIADFILTGLKVTGLAVATGAIAKFVAFLLGPVGMAIMTMVALWSAWELNILGVKDALSGLADVVNNIGNLEPIKAIKNFIETASEDPIGTSITLGLTIQAVSMLAGMNFLRSLIYAASLGIGSIAGTSGLTGFMLLPVIPIAIEMGIEAFTGENVEGLGDYIDSFWKWVEEQINEATKRKSTVDVQKKIDQLSQGKLKNKLMEKAKPPTIGEQALGVSKFLAEHPLTTTITIGVAIRGFTYMAALTKALLGASLGAAAAEVIANNVKHMAWAASKGLLKMGVASAISFGVYLGLKKLLNVLWKGEKDSFAKNSISMAGAALVGASVLTKSGTIFALAGKGFVAFGITLGLKKLMDVVWKGEKDSFTDKALKWSAAILGMWGIFNIWNPTGQVALLMSLGIGISLGIKKLMEVTGDVSEQAQKKIQNKIGDIEAEVPVDIYTKKLKSTVLPELGLTPQASAQRIESKASQLSEETITDLEEFMQKFQKQVDKSNKELSNFEEKLVRVIQQLLSATENKSSGGPIGFQTGGAAGFVPGSGSGDKIPAMLEPGEFVWNKELVQKFPGLIKGVWEGFKKGGPVSQGTHYYGPGPDEEGDEAPFPKLESMATGVVDRIEKSLMKYAENQDKAAGLVSDLRFIIERLLGSLADLADVADWVDSETSAVQKYINDLEESLKDSADSISEQAQKFKEIEAISSAFERAGLDYDKTGQKLSYLRDQLEKNVTSLKEAQKRRSDLSGEVNAYKEEIKRLKGLSEEAGQLTISGDTSLRDANREALESLRKKYEEQKSSLEDANSTIDKRKKTIDEFIQKIKNLPGVFSFAVDETDKMAKAFKNLGENEITDFASYTRDLISSSKERINALEALGKNDAAKKAQEELDAFKKALEEQGISVKDLMDKQEESKTAFDKLANRLNIDSDKLRSAINSTISTLSSLASSTGKVDEGTSAMLDGLTSAAQAAMQGNWFQVGLSLFEGFMGSWIERLKAKRDKLQKQLDATYSMINQGLQELGSTISNFASGLVGPFSSALSGAINAIGSFAKMIQQGGGTVEGTQSAFSALLSITTGLLDSFTNLLQRSSAWDKLQKELEPLWDALANSLNNLIWPLVALVDWIKEYLGIADDVNDELGEITDLNVAEGFKRARTVWEAATPNQPATSVGGDEGPKIPKWAKTMIQPIKKALMPILDKLKGVKIGQKLRQIASNIVKFVANKIPQAWTWLQGMWTWLQKNAGPILEIVKQKAISLYNWFKNNFQTEFEKAMGNLKDWEPSDLEDKLDDVNNMLRNIGNALINVIAASAGAIVGGLSGILLPFVGVWAGAAVGAGAGWLLGQMANVPKLQSGGIVPGAKGSPQPVLAHGGEVVIPPGKDIKVKGNNENKEFRFFLDGEEITARVEEIQKKNTYANSGSTTGGGYGRS